LLRGVKTERVKILWGIVGLYFFVWFYTSQQTRFLLPILPLLALLCSIAASTLLRADRFLRTAVVVMVGLALTFGTLVSLFYDWQFLPVVFHLESRDSFLSRKTWFYDEIKWMNQHLPSDARVSMLGTMPYYLDREYAMTLADVRGFDYVFCAGECSLSQVTGLELIRQTQAVVPLSRTLNKGTLTMPTFLWRIQEASP
jgi:hypothetical protein